MNRKFLLFVLIIALCTSTVIVMFIIKRANVQTCIYQDNIHKMTVDIPKEWTYKLHHRVIGDKSVEGLPDFGIEIHIDGDSKKNIYFFYQEGTLNFKEPGMITETFETKNGQSGKLYTVSNDTTTRISFIFDVGHYGITTELDNGVYGANEKEIFKMIRSSWVKEK